MTAKHTPGPWTANAPSEDIETRHWTIRAPGSGSMVSFEVARISGRSVSDPYTAYLIAAAPDLKEQLIKMVHAYARLLENARDRICDLGGDCDPIEKMEADDPNLIAAKAAIAKATGDIA